MALYIDPGTGSMLFTILLGVVSVAVFFLRSVFVKLKFFFTSGKVSIDHNNLEYVIFTDDKRYWNIFGPICDEYEKRGIELHYYTMSSDDPALNKEYKFVKCEFIGNGNKAFSKMNLLKADIVLSTTPSLDVFQWKRSRDVKWYTHIFHGIYDITTYRIYGTDYYDAILIPGPIFEKQIRDLEAFRNLPNKEVITVGIPSLDTMACRLEKVEKKDNVIPTVLLAPSWGDNSILNRYGDKMIDALIATGYEVIIRPHPQSFKSEKELMDKLIAKYPDGEKVSWNRDNDNFNVLNKADIMISDFSGVVFDYTLVFGKPVIYSEINFDDSMYDAHWVDDELWTFKKLRQIGRQLDDNFESTIKATIDECLNSSAIEKELEIAKNEGWNNIGNSAKTVVDYLINKRSELIKVPEKEEK
ncbi:MAG: CDP-glycerol glycerophosphotransferase family protein [Saccharofermentans sp.]|nr:CDP-glycerol glycerophosphotransferase family protein [Saccharofermentans sp.]